MEAAQSRKLSDRAPSVRAPSYELWAGTQALAVTGRWQLEGHELDAGERPAPAAQQAATHLLLVHIVLLVKVQHRGHDLERRLGHREVLRRGEAEHPRHVHDLQDIPRDRGVDALPVLRFVDQDVRKVKHGQYEGDDAVDRYVDGVLPGDSLPLPRAAERVLDVVAEGAEVAEHDAGGEDRQVRRPLAVRRADGPKQQP
eukprot:scaffold103397_cov66-Phaeocystis_antarctica.AAC.4